MPTCGTKKTRVQVRGCVRSKVLKKRTVRRRYRRQKALPRPCLTRWRARATFPRPARGGRRAGIASLPRRASGFRKRLVVVVIVSGKSSRVKRTGKERTRYSQTLLSPTSSAISMLAPSTVPSRRPPFKQNFMLDVPDASVPAVEMCWLISEAGISISARVTE